MNIQHKWRAFFSVAATLLASSLAVAGIANTKHNLSASGTGTYKATTETQLCVYCHAPHNANPSSPLWNHTLSGATYQPYSSNTMKAAAPGQPTGASKLCLTCHDGTVALGSVTNVPGTHFQSGVITGLAATLLGTSADVGTDLRNDHPVSFTYDSALAAGNTELVNPATLTGKFRPESGQLQCSNCHDPHSDANPKFMLTGYQDGSGVGSPLCRTCHAKQYWSTTPAIGHRDSTKMWSGATIGAWGQNPFHIPGQNIANNANSTPKTNACETCHQPHGGISGADHLLKRPGGTTYNQSYLCLNCHNATSGLVAADKDIWDKINKTSNHPAANVAYANRHSSKRQPDGKVREDQASFANNNRHAECVDCHNPHAAAPGSSPDVSLTANNTTSIAPPVLNGVWGVQPNNWNADSGWRATETTRTVGSADQYSGYTIIDNVGDGAHFTYQLCFKCHSSWAFGTSPPPDIYGTIAGGLMSDVAREYNPYNKSFHPANGNPGENCFRKGSTLNTCGTGVDYSGSLLIGGTTPPQNIEVSCLECHSNKDPLASPGVGAKGPHGSDTLPILWAPYNDDTGQAGTSGHICFKCHKWSTYTSVSASKDATGFSSTTRNLHGYHVDRRDAPCTLCHTAVPHGMPNRHLLIFGRSNTPANITATPYNNHEKAVWSGWRGSGSDTFGIPSEVGASNGLTLDTIPSGAWTKNYCHSSGAGVGSC